MTYKYDRFNLEEEIMYVWQTKKDMDAESFLRGNAEILGKVLE